MTLATGVAGGLVLFGQPHAQGADPGILESATSTDVRTLPSSIDLQAFLPERGPFTFPTPYHTTGVRLTNAHDCSEWYDCVNSFSGGSWQNMNNSAGSDFLYIVIGLDKSNGGVGPSLFRYNKITGETVNLGALFDPGDDRTWGTVDGWYFSPSQPTTFYIGLDATLQRYDILTHATSDVFDITDEFGDDKEVYHAHTSADDRVHSFMLRLINNYQPLGCGTYREDTQQFSWFPAVGAFDECQVDKSGQWLLIKEDRDHDGGTDNRIVNLYTGTETVLLGSAGAAGAVDTGFGTMVAADATASEPGSIRPWAFGPLAPGSVVYHGHAGQSPSFTQISFANARSAALDQQYACGAAVNRVNGPRANEVACVRLDGSLATLTLAPVMTDLDAVGGGPDDDEIKQPYGNLDPTGQFFLWATNLLGDRIDAVMVRVPSSRLVTVPADTTVPAVAITVPADAATVSGGSVPLSATASDNVGVVGVQFHLDGANLGGEVTTAPFSWNWDTSTTTDGVHVLTALARDAAGNVTMSLPVAVTVLNTPAVPQISGVSAIGVIERLAAIRWTTNQLADSQVEYGPTTAYGTTTAISPALTASHLQTLTGLTPGTTYHYRVTSKNAAGATGTSGDFTFTTQSAPQISGITISAITTTSATVSWATDMPSDTLIEYGFTTAYGDATNLDESFVTTHLHGLYNLESGTTYHFRVYSATPQGVLSISGDGTFATQLLQATVTNVTASVADGAYVAGAVIPVQVTFATPVVVTGTPLLRLWTGSNIWVNCTGGSGTTTLTFTHVVASGQATSDLNYSSTSALILNGGTIQDLAGNPAILTLPPTGGAGSLATNKNIVIDAVPPTTTDVTSSVVNGLYDVGAVVPIQVTFNDAVFVTGTPQLLLETGAIDRAAVYTSGSGTSVLTFTYTVAAGDSSSDLNCQSPSPFVLTGATIRDAAGNNAELPVELSGTHSLAGNKAIKIDTAAPKVIDVTSPVPDGVYGIGAVIPVTVIFNKPVLVTGTPLLMLALMPASTNVPYTAGSGTDTLTFTYVVAAGQSSSDLNYLSRTALTLNGGTIVGVSGLTGSLTLPAGALGLNKGIAIDGTQETVTNVTSTAPDGIHGAGAVIPITMTFSRSVTVTGTPQLVLAVNPDTTIDYTSGSGTPTLTFTYTVAAGQSSSDLRYTSTMALNLNGGTIRDAAGNDAILTLPGVNSSGSLGFNKNIVISGIVQTP